MRSNSSLGSVDDLSRDLRDAARAMRQQPRFAALATLTLALGIGATTAIFSVVYAVLINPLPYPDADDLVRIVHSIGGIDQPYFNDAIATSYADNAQSLEDVGVWVPGETATITGAGDPEEVRALRASRGVLTTLGVPPAVGRWFSPAEDLPGAADVVMLSYGYWQRRLGGDRTAIDLSLTVNARPHRIIGVMPAGFRFGDAFDIILPLRIDRGRLIAGFRLLGVGRLRPGVTLTQANADSGRVLHSWFEQAGTAPAVRARWAPALQPLKRTVVGDVESTLRVLMGAIVVVLLLACANVANLLLVRADARRQEFAIRTALGARWTRIARQVVVESLLLALLGGMLGIGLAFAGLRALVAFEPATLPRLSEIAIDATVLGFALAISVISGLLFGLIPMARSAAVPHLLGRGATASRQRQRSQQALVTAQIAFALVLLVSAGLMIRSFQALRHVEPGFIASQHVQTFGIAVPTATVREPERVTRLQQDVLSAIAAIPGVTSAAFTTRVPMGSDRSSSALAVAGRADAGRTPPNHQVKIISPGMFETLGTPLVAGRDFTWTDIYDLREVAIVSENLARALWGSPAAALGQRVREYYAPRSRWREIVGVSANVLDDGANQPPPTTIYWPAQPLEELQSLSDGYQSRRTTIVLRTERAGTEPLFGELREAVRAISPVMPLAQVRTLDEIYDQSLARTSFALALLTVAGVMALLLGISGLYGVIAYAVSQRKREIGIRVAIGAQAGDIRRLFIRRGLTLAGVGVAVGLAAATAATRLMESLLFGITPLDPITFIGGPIVLAAAAVLATYLPTRRAVRVDPVETLRAE